MNNIERKIKVRTNKQNSIERHPVPLLGINYKVKITYRNIKIAELDVENKIIKISLPNRYKKSSHQKILDLAIEKMYEQVARVEVERAMEKTRIMLGFAPEDYEIKSMKKTLAKCEENKIIVNPEIVILQPKLMDYIILHQYCHLKYKTHSKGFQKMIARYEPDYKKYEQEILSLMI